MSKVFACLVFLCFCISAEAQKKIKEELYADAIYRLYKINQQNIKTSDTLYIIPNDIDVMLNKINLVAYDFPKLKTGDSVPIYILNPMEFHNKKVCIIFNSCQLLNESSVERRIVVSGCYIFYYKVKNNKYHFCGYKDYGI